MATVSGDLVGNLGTADATPLTVPLYRMAFPNTTGAFNVVVVAEASDGTSASWFINGLVQRNNSGTARLVGSSLQINNPRDIAAVGWTVALSTQTDTVVAVLTGALSTNINWTLKSEVILTP